MKEALWDDWDEEIPDRRWRLVLGYFEQLVYLNDDGTYEVYTRELNIDTLEKAMIKAQNYTIQEYKDFKLKMDKKIQQNGEKSIKLGDK